MDSKKNILIIHPEGNIYNNPNLYEISRFINQEFELDILIPSLKINQQPEEFNIIKYNRFFNGIKKRVKKVIPYKILIALFKILYIKKNYDLIIGVDQIGLIDAYMLSIALNTPYGYISYEIFFKEECKSKFKNLELIASRRIKFAIVQDKIRAFHLSKENQIDISKMILIPVASSVINEYKKSYLLYDELNISRDKKILLLMGSISHFNCVNEVIETIEDFPKSWVIVLHNRYGNTKDVFTNLTNDTQVSNKIFFSSKTIESPDEMYKILHSADLGLALYCPTFEDIYTGNNIKYIGLSSGKISTYLQNGLPFIMWSNTIYGEKNKKFNFGHSIREIKEIPNLLKNFKTETLNQNCINYFKKEISFDNYKEKLLNVIKHEMSDL